MFEVFLMLAKMLPFEKHVESVKDTIALYEEALLLGIESDIYDAKMRMHAAVASFTIHMQTESQDLDTVMKDFQRTKDAADLADRLNPEDDES